MIRTRSTPSVRQYLAVYVASALCFAVSYLLAFTSTPNWILAIVSAAAALYIVWSFVAWVRAFQWTRSPEDPA